MEIIEYHLTDAEKICSACGNATHEMSTEVRHEIKVIPAQVKLVKHVRHTYSCRHCEKEGIATPIVTAPMPSSVIPGSLVSPSLMAYVMSQKYVDAMPLYRQEQQFNRLGIELSRQAMANWMIAGADRWLDFLYKRMQHHLLQQDILHADETTLQVLKEPGRKAERSSYIWLYRTGRVGPPIVLYEYQETRAREHPLRFLKGFKGYLHVDGYAGYNDLPNITLVGCFAHARRKFDEALKALPPSAKDSLVTAKEGLNFFNHLFAIERQLHDVTPKERYEKREELSRPLMEDFLAWLKFNSPLVLPKSKLGEAIKYCLNQWPKLEGFLLDGRLEIDNNRSERSIKPFVIGRKNWLFANTPKGAKSSAIIYSIIETAKENKLNPFYYLNWLFEKLPNIDTRDPASLDKLLPWSPGLPLVCRIHS